MYTQVQHYIENFNQKHKLGVGVTRLGENSPDGWLFRYFGQWFENYRSNAHFWATFSTAPDMR
jgi:hypothetical protein